MAKRRETPHDRAVYRRNGRKAKGSTWHKKSHHKRRETAHDRAVYRRNGRKAKGW